MKPPFRLGFACNWGAEPELTWSYTPWSLRKALRNQVNLVDVGLQLPKPLRATLTMAFARRHEGRWVSNWQYSRVSDAICQSVIDRRVARTQCEAVLEVQDLAIPQVPYFILQDLTYDILLRLIDGRGGSVPHFPGLSRDDLMRRRDRQYQVYDRAAGILMMSNWAASTLSEWSGVPADKVHVVYPGRTAAGVPVAEVRPRPRPRRRLLLVGKDFHAKGGDLVVAAVERLRRSGYPDMTLTVAGPASWPLRGGIPPGVTFLGRVPTSSLPDLYHTHDLLVMPSRLEGFGIVFVEALAYGLPCVGRDAFAMPEIIVPGQNGALVPPGDDLDELATAITDILGDDDVYATCASRAKDVAQRFTWDRSAEQALAAIRLTLAS